MAYRHLKCLALLLAKQYAAIGGQAVIEGVMMRSPNAFVVAVRKPDGTIRLRRDQWFGLSKKWNFLKKPFLRGVIILIETMVNGIVSLNYSANIAMDEEMKNEARKKGVDEKEYIEQKRKNETVSYATFFSIFISFLFGIGLFVLTPHYLTAWLEETLGASWGLQSFKFHALDGTIKATIFLIYIGLIGMIPDIRRVFQYHGAEHKSISTFEHEEDLNVDNAIKYTTFHPRCGTTFIFFLLFISIILFAMIFAVVPVGEGKPFLVKHMLAVGFKIILTFPIAGISYEIIKYLGSHTDSVVAKVISIPGMLLQRLTTRDPDPDQLEVALTSIKTVLYLEDRYNLREADSKIIEKDEIDIGSIKEVENTTLALKDFLEH